MPFCPFCGSEISDDDAFCRSCGAVVSGGQSAPPKRKDRTKLIAVVMVLIVLVSGLTGIVILLTKEAILDDVSQTYRWDYGGQRFSYTLTVERSHFNKLVGSDIDRSGTVSEGRYVVDGKTVFGVSDYIVVDEYITKMCQDFCSMYKEKFGDDPTNEQYTDMVTAFVQICIDYDDEEAGSSSEYWRYPLETLCDRTGDCEDTSILLAALLDAKGIKAGIVLAPGHAMAAISTSDYTPSGDPIVTHHSDIDYLSTGTGVDYYLIETTWDSYHKVGEGIGQQFDLVYLHLYMGSSADYY